MNTTTTLTEKEKERFKEAMQNMHQEFLRMVQKYQRVYDLPIHISLDLTYSEGRKVPSSEYNVLGLEQTFQMWSTKNYTMEADKS